MLAKKHQDKLAGTASLNPQISPQTYEHRLIADMVQKGARFDEVHFTLCGGRHDSYYNHLYTMSPEDASMWLYTHIADVRDAMRLSLKMVRWITLAPQRWKGQSGLSEKNVLFAHAHRCYTSGTVLYSLSVRKIAEAVEAERESVIRCNAALCEPLIQQVSVGRGDLASTYRLNDVSRVRDIAYPKNEGSTERRWGKKEAKEALFVRYKRTYGLFRNKPGLGSSAYEVWCTTHIADFTQTEIIERTGQSKGTVSKAVTTLCSHGLLIKKGRRYKADADADLKSVAEQLLAVS